MIQVLKWRGAKQFSAGSVSMLIGEAGSKNTRALLNVAVSAALGKAWLDHKVQGGPVLLVDGEGGARRMARRFDIRNPGDVDHLQSAIREMDARFVVIDALADVMPGADENSVQDMQPIFVTLCRIAEETQTALMVVHHSSKTGDYRGSTAMLAAVDLVLKVESKPQVAPESDIAGSTIAELLEARGELTPYNVLWAAYRLGKDAAAHEHEAAADSANYDAVIESVNREMAALQDAVQVAPTS